MHCLSSSTGGDFHPEGGSGVGGNGVGGNGVGGTNDAMSQIGLLSQTTKGSGTDHHHHISNQQHHQQQHQGLVMMSKLPMPMSDQGRRNVTDSNSNYCYCMHYTPDHTHYS